MNFVGSSTTGKPLPEKDLERAIETCDLVMKLDEIKTKVNIIFLYDYKHIKDFEICRK